ncbi:ATP-binding protein [Metabacillus elymi]|nr:ATP-binding protein [Metabacillus sp. KUDC1714]QNF29943.1 PAS domain S-box protein [Metabacillus sp. KUDC1714]
MNKVPFYILESKQYCSSKGMNTNDIPFPKLCLMKDVHIQRVSEYQEFLTVSRHFIKKLLFFMKNTPTLVVISDDKGYVLEMYGDQTIQSMVHSLGIQEGVLFDESGVGTNSISLALKHKEPIQLIGTDHYHDCLHSTTCMTVPFYFEDLERRSGTVSIMSTIDYASSFHLGLLSSAVDSIERELKIRKQNRRLNILHQVMVDSTQNGIVIIDTKGIITEFNQAGEYITGFDKDMVIGSHIDILKPISSYVNKILKNGSKYKNLEVTFYSLIEGKEKTSLFDALPIYDENNSLLGAFVQFRDISDRIELEKQVIATEKLSLIGKLGAGLAHEIRNPLTSVIGFIQLLKKEVGKKHTEKHFKIILDELERIKRLVNQLMMMAKPSTNERTECNIVELTKETIYLMNSQATQHNVTVDFQTGLKENLHILIDESQIKQVLINIIKNAIEAIDNGGNINVSLAQVSHLNDYYIEIEVKDDGNGLTEEQLKKLFTPFYSSKEKGLGLGLSICKQIIESHKGKMEVSSFINEGTTFKIKLPR